MSEDKPKLSGPLISSELKLRVVSAVVLGAIVLFDTWIGGTTFALLWAIAAILVLHEFIRICSSAVSHLQRMAAFAALFLVLAAWFSANVHFACYIFIAATVLIAVWEFVIRKTVWCATGLAYACLPFFAMSELRADSQNGLLVILLLFACVWGADIFAYFAGRSIGGPKLAPRISPKKTWAGFAGSLVGAMLLSWLVVWWSGHGTTIMFFAAILLIAIVSQIGDLVESSFKRRFDVKDSGNLIPGHGGVLDRIDGLIAASVALWLALLLVRQDGMPMPKMFVDALLLP